MRRKGLARVFAGAVVAAAMLGWAAPAAAHGDHDARPVARQLAAGSHLISLWQIYPDAGSSMAAHLVIVFDAVGAVPVGVDVVVTVNGKVTAVLQSPTTANALETVDPVGERDIVRVSISEAGRTWDLDAVVVPIAPTSGLPMRELVFVSIFLTAGTALWAVRRTARAWRPQARPV